LGHISSTDLYNCVLCREL